MPQTELLNPQKIMKLAGVEYGWRVADLGCGTGFIALAAARLVGDKGLVYGVDVLKSALRSVESRARLDGLTNFKAVWSNLEVYGATKIPQGTLDLALIVNTLFQSKKHQEIIREASRLLKDGGLLLIVDWKKQGSPMGPPMNDRIDKENVKQIAQRAGFSLEQEVEPWPYHFGLVFRKAD